MGGESEQKGLMTLEYVWGAAAGLVYGGCVGFLKYIFLWRKLLNPKDNTPIKSTAIYGRMFISYFINLAALLAVYLLRDIMPFEFVSTAIGAAVGLSISGKIFSIQKIYRKAGEYNLEENDISGGLQQ